MGTQQLSNNVATKSIYRCLVCSRYFKYFTSLIQHELTHVSERSSTRHESGNNYKSRTKRSAEKSMMQPHECMTCGKRFSLQENLNRHQLIHTNKRPFQCTHCPKSFRLSQHLKEHIRIHTGEKPYKCTICGHAFCQISNLKSHQKTHSKDKAFKCNQCDKAFRRYFTLKQHKTTHVRPLNLVVPQASTSQHSVNKNSRPQITFCDQKIHADNVFIEESTVDSQNNLLPRDKRNGSADSNSNNLFSNSPTESANRCGTLSPKYSPEQHDALQSRHLSISKFSREEHSELTFPENNKAVDYKWKREICRGWMPNHYATKYLDDIHQNEDESGQSLNLKRKLLTRISSEGSDTWSPNSIASSCYENSTPTAKSQNAKDEPCNTQSTCSDKREIDSPETQCSPRGPTTGFPSFHVYNHDNETNGYLRMISENSHSGSIFNNATTFYNDTGPNHMTLQDIAQKVSFVPLIEWKPVITGWQNVFDGRIYTKSI